MRNTQNISIIRSEPPPAVSDETTWSLSGAAVGFISWLLALGIPFLIYGSNTLFVLLYTWPFFLALMPVAVDDFNRRTDVRSAVPLATGVVLSTNESSLGINGKNVVQSPRYAASSARQSRELGRVMG